MKGFDKDSLVQICSSGPVRITVTGVSTETGGVQGAADREEKGGEEYVESEESVELPSSGLALTTVTSGDTETRGVHGADRLEEEEKTGRRRRSSVRERVEKIEEAVAAEKISSRDRLMSDRRKKFEKIEIKEQSVEKKTEAKKKREEKKLGNKIENEQEDE